MPLLRKPWAISGDATIGIAAPAGPVDADLLRAGEEMLQQAGLRTLRRDDLLARDGYLAGDDARRAGELMELLEDSRVDAVLCARGGYGCHRIVQALEPRRVRDAATPLVGSSDITTLLLWQQRCVGLVGIHGPMLDRGADLDPESLKALVEMLRGSRSDVALRGRGLGGGRGEGVLTGGSLSLVAASLGTPWEVDTVGAILLLEEKDEAPYRVDRMLQQLHAAGKFRGIAGVGVGSLTGCEDSRYGTKVEEVVEAILRPLDVPLVMGLPFGHARCNQPWPVGARAAIDAERGEVVLLERGVAVT